MHAARSCCSFCLQPPMPFDTETAARPRRPRACVRACVLRGGGGGDAGGASAHAVMQRLFARSARRPVGPSVRPSVRPCELPSEREEDERSQPAFAPRKTAQPCALAADVASGAERSPSSKGRCRRRRAWKLICERRLRFLSFVRARRTYVGACDPAMHA